MVEGCNAPHVAKGYCNTHYRRFKKFGDGAHPTRYDDNEVILHEDYAEIKIHNTKLDNIALIKIDIEDIEKIKGVRWKLSTGRLQYARNNKKGLLHRYVLGVEIGEDIVVDHINGDTFDCRKSNLRICTQAENVKNTSLNTNNTSGVTGVSWCKREQKWRAYINYNNSGKTTSLGYFNKFEDAVKARQKAEIEEYGEFSPLVCRGESCA